MTLSVKQSAGRCEVSTPGAQLLLAMDHDRWGHALWLPLRGAWRCVLQSVEGTAAEPQSPSPVFQSIQVERLGETVCELQLFGQSGRDIYSGAIRFDAELETVHFDLAVRLQGPREHESIVSTYATSHPAEICADVPDGSECAWPDVDGLRVKTLCPAVGLGAGRIACVPATAADGPRIVIGPSPEPGKSAAQPRRTVRWQYGWMLPSAIV